MSINPLLTNYGPGASLYAPSGGGGGGGAGPNLTLSTLTLASSFDLTPSILSPGTGSQININANGGVIFGDVPPNLGASVNIYGGTGQIWCEDQGANVVLQILPDVSTGKCTLTQGVGGTGIALVNISSINGAAPGGSGGVGPNLALSSLSMNGAISLANNTINLDTGNTAALYFNAGNSNSYLTGRSNAVVAIGTQANAAALQVGDTSINMPTAVYMTSQITHISTLNVSSVNGAAYPPIATSVPVSTFQFGFNQQFNSLSFSGGTLQNVSSIFSSITISTIQQFTLSGGLTGVVIFQGSGNTNPLNNSTNTGFSGYRMNLLVDEGLPTQQIYPIAQAQITSANNSPPPGNTSYRPASWSNVNATASYMVNPAPDYNTPTAYGQEVMFQQFGSHTYKMLYEIDCFLNSGDPGAGYNMVVQIPSANMPPLNANYQ